MRAIIPNGTWALPCKHLRTKRKQAAQQRDVAARAQPSTNPTNETAKRLPTLGHCVAEELLAGVMTAAPVGAQNGKEEGLAPSLALTQGSFFDEKGKWGHQFQIQESSMSVLTGAMQAECLAECTNRLHMGRGIRI